jgi:hypothetical protein
MDVYLLRARILKALAVVLFFFTSQLSRGAVIFDSGITELTASDPTQLGRLSRDTIISSWPASKSFPGVVNPTTPFSYTTFAVPVIFYPFIQITIDDVAGTGLTFASAYLNSYQPTAGLNVNYLGDAGASGNFFGTDPRVFQVVAPLSSSLLVVVNDTSPSGTGIGQNYHIVVEGFTDTNFDDAVPEPTTFALGSVGFGIVALILVSRIANLAMGRRGRPGRQPEP